MYNLDSYSFCKSPFLSRALELEEQSLHSSCLWESRRLKSSAELPTDLTVFSAFAWISVKTEPKNLQLTVGCYAMFLGLIRMQEQQDPDLPVLLSLLRDLEPQYDGPLSEEVEDIWIAKLMVHAFTEKRHGRIHLFGKISQLRHACLPNVSMRLDGSLAVIQTIRPVRAGEELSISFVNFPIDGPCRAEMLSAQIECYCYVCRSDLWLSVEALRNGYPLAEKKHCWWCGSPALSRCSGCRVATYCCGACQASNWPAHKQICGLISRPETSKDGSKKITT